MNPSANLHTHNIFEDEEIEAKDEIKFWNHILNPIENIDKIDKPRKVCLYKKADKITSKSY